MKKAAAPLIVVAMILLALAVRAGAEQAGKISRIGILFIGSHNQPHLEAFDNLGTWIRKGGANEGSNFSS